MSKENVENPADEAPIEEVAEKSEQCEKCGSEANQGEDSREDCKDEPTKEESAAPESPDWKGMYARLLADFDNFKKRVARDKEDTYRYAESDIIGDILPVVDNLALALGNAKDKQEDPFVKGVKLVYDAMLSALKSHQAEPFDSIGAELETSKMEAIATMPDEKYAEGLVSAEVKRGWLIKGKVLRVAQVVVSSGKKTDGE